MKRRNEKEKEMRKGSERRLGDKGWQKRAKRCKKARMREGGKEMWTRKRQQTRKKGR